MRFAAALPFLAAVVLLTGCAPGANGELRTLVDDVAPAERDTLGCEWESNWGSGTGTDGAKAYYACSWFVPGKLSRVSRDILARLNAHGFKVACRSDSRTVEFMAHKRTTTIDIDVLADGFVNARAVEPADVDIPTGSLYVGILAEKHRDVQTFAQAHPRCT
jgi:hypothetical protein